MNPRPPQSASMIFAAVLCIACGSLMVLTAFFLGLVVQFTRGQQPQVVTAHVRIVLQVAAFSLLALGSFGAFLGIALLSLKNWARKAIVFCSGTAVVLSFLCLYACLAFLAYPAPEQLAPGTSRALWSASFGIFLFTFGISLWLVILFTRDEAKACFDSPTAVAGASSSRAPRCPLPLALLAGYYIVVGVISGSQLALPDRVPYMFFGHALIGAPRNLIDVAAGSLCLVAAIGLFKLKPWSINLAIGIEFFSLAKRLVTILDSRSTQTMRNALATIAAHGYKAPASDPTLHLRYFESLAFGLSLAMLVLVLLTRSRFRQAASETESLSTGSQAL